MLSISPANLLSLILFPMIDPYSSYACKEMMENYLKTWTQGFQVNLDIT